MIKGTVVLEDIKIEFEVGKGNVIYTVTDLFDRCQKTVITPQDRFFKALAIAVHNDGMPEWEKDYPDAELAMPNERMLRWIP